MLELLRIIDLLSRVEKKESVKNIFDMKLAYDLGDIWRIRNPDKKQYTWRQKRPFVQRRLSLIIG